MDILDHIFAFFIFVTLALITMLGLLAWGILVGMAFLQMIKEPKHSDFY